MIWGGVGDKGDRDDESLKIYGGRRWRDGGDGGGVSE